MFFPALFIILYIFVSWCKPKMALFLILALLPIYQLRFEVFGLPTTFLETMVLILFVCWLIGKLKTQNSKLKTIFQNLKLNDWGWLVILWLVVGLIAVFVSPDKWGALGYWRAYFLEPVLFLIIFTSLIKDKKDLQSIFYALSFLALFIGGMAIYQKITGQGMASLETWQYPLVEIIRPIGPFPQSNFLGLFLGPLVLLFLGKFVEFFKNKKLISSSTFPAAGGTPPKAVAIYYLLVSILSIFAIIFARSEGAILGVLAGLIFFLIFYLKKQWRIALIVVLLIITIYLLLLSPWRATIWQKITFQDLSLKLRLNIWQGAWQMIASHPFLGVGLRGYQELVSQYQQPFSLPGVQGIISNELHPYPHNLFLALWVELGFLGLIVFLLIVIKFFIDGFKKIKNQKIFHFSFLIFILAAMVVVLVHGLVDTPYFKNDLAILFWLLISLMIINKYE